MGRASELPLADVSVLELGNIVSAPFASLLLADLGAEVVKVERPGTGDLMRESGTSGDAIMTAFNRNKRSLALDLQTDRGKEAYRDLAAAADVVIENLGPGVADRLGVGYGDLSERNRELIYLSIKGFQPGPYGDRPGMDLVAEAMSGLVAMTGDPGGRPLRVGTSIADIGAALYGVIGVVLALRDRDRTGEGQRIDSTLFESATHWMSYWMTYADMTGTDHPALGSSHPAFAPYDVFETNESDRWVFVGVTSDRQWPSLCRVLDRPDLLADERFETGAGRVEHESELLAEIESEIRARDRDSLVDALLAEGVPTAPVNQPSDLLGDEHLDATGLATTVSGCQDGVETEVETITTPLRGDRITTSQRRDPPELGEHSRELLREAGYDEGTIEQLVAAGVTETPTDK